MRKQPVSPASWITVILLLAVALSLDAQAALQARVQSFTGKVEIQTNGAAWTPAAVGLVFPVGTMISTGFNSEAVLELGPSILRVKALTRMRLDELAQKEGTISTGLYLKVGRVQADVKTVEGLKHDFKLASPVSTAAVRGTTFDYDGVNLDVHGGTVLLLNQYGQGGSVGQGGSGSSTGQGDPLTGEDGLEAGAGVQIYTNPGGSGILQPPNPTGSVRIHWIGPVA